MTEPRSLEQRVADTLKMLSSEEDLWLATCSRGTPHLVPLSFVFVDGVVVLSTPRESRTVHGIRANATVRMCVGRTRDVVTMDGDAQIEELANQTGYVEAFAEKCFDPQMQTDYVLLVVAPQRMQAWREDNEIEGRTLMRSGSWIHEK